MKSKPIRVTVSGLLWFVAAFTFVGCSAPPTGAPVDRTGQPAGTAADSSKWTLTVEPLPSPAGASSTSPKLTVGDGRTILSWLELGELGATLKFAERTSSGWSEPRVVRSGADLLIYDADVPSVRALPGGTLVAHWLQEDGPDPEAYKLPLSWSKDGGHTWSQPAYPHHDKTQTQHGFASLFQAPGAGLGLVWLDGRGINPAQPDAPESGMALWAAVYGPDGKQTGEKAVDSRVCECCQTSVATTSEGVIVAYRDRSAEEIRDIYVTRFDGSQWSTPAMVHADGWQINGCPVNGPAVDARGRDVAVAWYTAKNDEGQAFAAFSHDGGRTFGQPVRVDDKASLGHVGIALLADGSAVVSFVELEGSSQLRARRVEQNGSRSPAVTIANVSGMRHPSLTQGPDELVFAWTETPPLVRTARAALGVLGGR
jgi:hypothetical protein